jgi:hypothetical protein
MGITQPPRVESPQAIVVKPRAKDGLDGALPHLPQVLPPVTLLPLPGSLIGRVEEGDVGGVCTSPWQYSLVCANTAYSRHRPLNSV